MSAAQSQERLGQLPQSEKEEVLRGKADGRNEGEIVQTTWLEELPTAPKFPREMAHTHITASKCTSCMKLKNTEYLLNEIATELKYGGWGDGEGPPGKTVV